MKKKTEISNPLVTVGIPVYNDELYVALAIDDILAQSFTNLEIIISDNCSTDGSAAICRQYADKDSRIRYFRQQSNIGPHANFKYLLDCAQGTYFMWAASDDRWDKEFIAKHVQLMQEDANVSIAFCRYAEIDEEGTTVSPDFQFDFSGHSAVSRITNFHMTLSGRRDAFFYGMLRKDKTRNLQLIKWWWINKGIPMSNAYPPLSHLLAAGDYRLVQSDTPLWLNRIHTKSKPRHSADYSSKLIFSFFAFHLRKINQLYETERAVIRGSGSIFTGILVFPILAGRCLYDCAIESYRFILSIGRWLQRK